jgi:hypothetical protein
MSGKDFYDRPLKVVMARSDLINAPDEREADYWSGGDIGDYAGSQDGSFGGGF